MELEVRTKAIYPKEETCFSAPFLCKLEGKRKMLLSKYEFDIERSSEEFLVGYDHKHCAKIFVDKRTGLGEISSLDVVRDEFCVLKLFFTKNKFDESDFRVQPS